MNRHVQTCVCLGKRVFRFGLLLHSGVPLEPRRGRGILLHVQLVRILPECGHRRSRSIAVNHGGCMAASCVAPRNIDSTAPPPFERCRPPYLWPTPANDLSFELRSDHILLQSSTCLSHRSSLYLSQPCPHFSHRCTEKFMQQQPDQSG